MGTLDTHPVVIIGVVETYGAYAIPHAGILDARTLTMSIHNEVIPQTVLLTVVTACFIADAAQGTGYAG